MCFQLRCAQLNSKPDKVYKLHSDALQLHTVPSSGKKEKLKTFECLFHCFFIVCGHGTYIYVRTLYGNTIIYIYLNFQLFANLIDRILAAIDRILAAIDRILAAIDRILAGVDRILAELQFAVGGFSP